MGPIGFGKIFRSFLKSLGASLLMGGAAWMICMMGEWEHGGVSVEKIGLLSGAILAALLVYGGTSFLLGSEELRLAVEGVKKKYRFLRS